MTKRALERKDWLTRMPHPCAARVGKAPIRLRPPPFAYGEEWGTNAPRRALTLVEMLVVMTIIALLMALLVPSLTSARDQMKMLKCASHLKTIAFDFQLFASGESASGRGDSDTQLGSTRFYVEDFHEGVYKVSEFWDLPGHSVGQVPRSNPMACPSVDALLIKTQGFPCRDAVSPYQDVSLAVNMRLYRAVVQVGDRSVLAPAASSFLTPRVLEHPYAPLMIEVEGHDAVKKMVDPFYIAPPVSNRDDPYSSGQYWSPATRHHGKTFIGFIGGHVLSSRHPQRESWDWTYQAETN